MLGLVWGGRGGFRMDGGGWVGGLGRGEGWVGLGLEGCGLWGWVELGCVWLWVSIGLKLDGCGG